MFINKLYELGKMEATQINDQFVVRQYRVAAWFLIGVTICWGAVLVWVIFWPNDTVDAFVYIGFSFFFFFSLLSALALSIWKIDVTRDTISCRSILKKEIIYSQKDITKVVEKGAAITLYTGERKICKVSPGCGGFPILLERLKSEGIPFEQRER
ncbi:hypothetical protein SDC9_51624 [bioreactor metagenome]|uniref:Uncharacterized protein n=1 Tax=bioreactor metagenome TaxID=1076179 RepID=A0A644WN41_9ZZZZ